MQLEFDISGQLLKRTDSMVPVANSRGYLKAHFNLPTDYKGTITANFIKYISGALKSVPMTVQNGVCLVPDDILASSARTDLTVYVWLSSTDTDIYIPTNHVPVKVLGSGGGTVLDPLPDSTVNQYQEIATMYTDITQKSVAIQTVNNNVITLAANAKISEDKALISETNAKLSEDNSKLSEVNAKSSETVTQQAMTDYLNMVGKDIATLVGGKIPMSQIPATATQEIYAITNEIDKLSLVAQRGDLAELVESVGGIPTIVKSWQLLGDGDPTIGTNWIVWGTSYAVQAGNASAATYAEDAGMINGHRLVTFDTQDLYNNAVKDDNAFYLVKGV